MSSEWQQRQVGDLSDETVYKAPSRGRCVHLNEGCKRLARAKRWVEVDVNVLWDDEDVCEFCDPESPMSGGWCE